MARLAAGLTQQQLADLTGLDRGYVGLLERGVSSPTLNTLLQLAPHLKISASELVSQVEAKLSLELS